MKRVSALGNTRARGDVGPRASNILGTCREWGLLQCDEQQLPDERGQKRVNHSYLCNPMETGKDVPENRDLTGMVVVVCPASV